MFAILLKKKTFFDSCERDEFLSGRLIFTSFSPKFRGISRFKDILFFPFFPALVVRQRVCNKKFLIIWPGEVNAAF